MTIHYGDMAKRAAPIMPKTGNQADQRVPARHRRNGLAYAAALEILG